ncbi:unnamed protein product, partial [Amoebophrya sp. A25]|eukprot:GSA25T00005913001.1
MITSEGAGGQDERTRAESATRASEAVPLLGIEDILTIANRLWMSRLPMQAKKRIKEIVDLLPVSRRGGYSHKTLADALHRKFNLRLTPAKFARLVTIFDVDESGHLDLPEIIGLISHLAATHYPMLQLVRAWRRLKQAGFKAIRRRQLLARVSASSAPLFNNTSARTKNKARGEGSALPSSGGAVKVVKGPQDQDGGKENKDVQEQDFFEEEDSDLQEHEMIEEDILVLQVAGASKRRRSDNEEINRIRQKRSWRLSGAQQLAASSSAGGKNEASTAGSTDEQAADAGKGKLTTLSRETKNILDPPPVVGGVASTRTELLTSNDVVLVEKVSEASTEDLGREALSEVGDMTEDVPIRGRKSAFVSSACSSMKTADKYDLKNRSYQKTAMMFKDESGVLLEREAAAQLGVGRELSAASTVAGPPGELVALSRATGSLHARDLIDDYISHKTLAAALSISEREALELTWTCSLSMAA